MRTGPETPITVTIQRVGGATVTVNVPEDTNVLRALELASISLESSESVFYNGEPIANMAEAVLDDGDALQIVQNKKGGARA